MTEEEYYADERAYEAMVDADYERYERDEEDDEEQYEDEWQSHGFRDEADYNQWRYGSGRYL